MGQVHAKPWRTDAESVAHQLRALAGSESFADTLAWVERSGAQPRDLDKIACPVPRGLGHPRPDPALPPGEALAADRARRGAA